MDYLSKYGFDQKAGSPVRSFQMGGAAPAPAGPEAGAPPVEGGGPDLQGMLMQVLETQDPNMALEFCNILGEQMQGAEGGAPAGPEAAGAPAPPAGPPSAMTGGRIYRKGGVFSKNGNSISFSRK